MSHPRISIVNLSLNQRQYLEKTMRSVLDQEYPNLEYIIIDGGSTDGSVDIIKKYADQLHYWVSEPDNGLSHAINKGFAQASGEIMMWINSDDLLLPGSLFKIAEIFSQNPDVEWIVGKSCYEEVSSGNVYVRDLNFDRYDYLYSVGKFIHVPLESTAWRRDLWERAGGYMDENLPDFMDSDLWARFWGLTESWNLPFPLGVFRLHGDNRSVMHIDRWRAVLQQSRTTILSHLSNGQWIALYLIKRHKRLFHWLARLSSRHRYKQWIKHLAEITRPVHYRVLRVEGLNPKYE